MCQKVKQADSAYIAGTYGRFDAVMSKGEGAHYEGPDGKRYKESQQDNGGVRESLNGRRRDTSADHAWSYVQSLLH